MNVIKPVPQELSVFIPVNRFSPLIDKRTRSNGIYFGTIDDIAKNLGVKLKDTDAGVIASAPKMRLQIFVEKLHFSGVPYSAA
jgi:hypothetical protein